MSNFSEIQNILYINYIWDILEVLLVTSCVSTILFLLTKNKYVSYLSSAPVFYIFTLLKYGNTHLILLIVAMSVQAIIIVTIEHQRKKKIIQKVQEKI